jgi:hypothetical protein
MFGAWAISGPWRRNHDESRRIFGSYSGSMGWETGACDRIGRDRASAGLFHVKHRDDPQPGRAERRTMCCRARACPDPAGPVVDFQNGPPITLDRISCTAGQLRGTVRPPTHGVSAGRSRIAHHAGLPFALGAVSAGCRFQATCVGFEPSGGRYTSPGSRSLSVFFPERAMVHRRAHGACSSEASSCLWSPLHPA